jgi:hypothetical protein
MRRLILLATLLVPAMAFAQTGGPARSGTTTPAPVPSVPPATSQNDGTVTPPEQIAPGVTDGGGSAANAAPQSGAPREVTPGTAPAR